MSLFGKSDKTESQRDQESFELPRIKSGIRRLDSILKGGFVRGSHYSLLGPPGAGKTIFSNQLCFNHVKINGGKCLYLTLLSEGIAPMIMNLKTLDFYDELVAGEAIRYLNCFQVVLEDKGKGLMTLVRNEFSTFKPNILILDSIDALRSVIPDELEYAKFLHEFYTFGRLMNCTTLSLSFRPYDCSRAENAAADGIIEISQSLIGPRAVRELTVHKFRGTSFLAGKHELEITKQGVQIHPRTEVQFDEPPEVAEEKRIRMPFGIKSLDEMMMGGPLSGSATALIGAPGTGKTMLGLSFLTEGARLGHKGIYFGFYEPTPRLIEKAGKIGLPFEKYVKNGMIEVIWQPPLEHYMDSLAESLLEKLKAAEDAGRRRLFIDGIEGFRAAAIYPERVPRFLSAFFNQLRTQDITTVMAEELGIFDPSVELPNPELANVVESVILLRYVELRSQLHRLISVMKMRESKFDTSIREFQILDEGIRVADSFRSAEAVLAGHARERGEHD